jgi:hypothetical protein
MDPNKTSIERAFQLAKTGRFANVAEIKTALGSEGYSTLPIVGRVLNAQLRKLIRDARPSG